MTNNTSRDEQFFDDIPENVSQFDGGGGSGELEIVIGFDFGTSSTKAVVHIFNVPGEPAFAVPFGDFAHESSEYLLPTKLFVNPDGFCSLKRTLDAALLTDIKVGLMQTPDRSIEPVSGPPCNASASTVATAYLALVLRYVRCWFISNKRRAFGDYSLNWSFNLGLPAEIKDNPKEATFDLVGKAAWLVSERPAPVTIACAEKAVRDIKNNTSESEDALCDFELIPEVIAEVVGYARSRLRDEGLHLLVDIGASTLDVCSFILADKGGGDHYSILTANVELLGAKQLHLERIEGLKRAVESHVKNLSDPTDPLCLIENDIEAYIPSLDKELRNVVERDFAGKCEKLLKETFEELKKLRDPDSPRWSDYFPVFLCGGAKEMSVYNEIVSNIEKWLIRWERSFIDSPKGVRRITLPKPESLEAEIDNELYHRLAVAWGLSYQSYNIGEYKVPSEIQNFPPRPRSEQDIYRNYVSKDMV